MYCYVQVSEPPVVQDITFIRFLLEDFFNSTTKKESGIYDYSKMFPWVVGAGATERTLYLSEQLRQVLCYNYGGLV